MRSLHDGADSEDRVAVAMATPQYAGAIGKVVRLTRRTTVVTDESAAPPGALKVGCAGHLIGEQPLKLRQRARERQISSVNRVDNHGHPRLAQILNTLPVVGIGDIWISTETSNGRLAATATQEETKPLKIRSYMLVAKSLLLRCSR